MGVWDQRVEFVVRASRGEPVSGACREYGISRPTGYLWLRRFRAQGVAGVEEHSRRPAGSPRRTSPGGRRGLWPCAASGPIGAHASWPRCWRNGVKLPVVTVHRVLLRHDLVRPADRRTPATERWERERVNELWQMDFKGQKRNRASVGPLSILDDKSRYAVALEQTGATRGEAVRERLEGVLAHSGRLRRR